MLKKIVSYVFVISIFYSSAVFCMDQQPEAHSAFIAKQGNTILKTEGNVEVRHAPFSTFKAPLALMAFNSHFFETTDSPTLPFKEEYEKNLQSWYTREKGIEYKWCQEQTPATFMKNSVIWISHLITAHLQPQGFQECVNKLNYGNRDVSGTPGENDGLLNSWLGTSLKISPREQAEFLEKLLANAFDVSKDAHEKTREIMDREEQWGEWKLYGKTGGGGDTGWFIGWIEKKDADPVIFAQYLDKTDINLELTEIKEKTVGLTAKEVAKRHLMSIWQEARDK